MDKSGQTPMSHDSEERAGAQRKAAEARRLLNWMLVFLFVVSLAAMGFGGRLMSPNKDKDLWFELFSGGKTLLLATVVATIVSRLVDKYKSAREEERIAEQNDFAKRRDTEIRDHEEQRRLTDLRLRLLRDIVETYNDVKAVRRRLRALGLRDPTGPLTALQVEGLHREISNLLDAQLAFEALKEEVDDTRAFAEATGCFSEKLKGAEGYLNSRKGKHGVLGEWQCKRGYAVVVANTSASEFKQQFERLQEFMAPQSDPPQDFNNKLTDPIHDIAEMAREQLYPEGAAVTSASQSAAPRVAGEHSSVSTRACR